MQFSVSLSNTGEIYVTDFLKAEHRCKISSHGDKHVNRVEPVGENPFAPKVLPMSPEWTGGYVAERGGFEPPIPVLPV